LASEYVQPEVVPSWLISYLKEEVAVTLKSKEQRERAETIEGGTSKVTPDRQKRMEAKAGNSSF
jgi:hypothetical protein